MSTPAPDSSNGWEAAASRAITALSVSPVGTDEIRQWSRQLVPGGAVLELGAGPGGPRSQVLHDQGFRVYALDAAPTLARTYSERFPSATVACEPAEDSTFFGRTFEGVLAWGLLFLLPPLTQRLLLRRVAQVLSPGAHLLFTAPSQACCWSDLTTGLPSTSLGQDEYVAELERAVQGVRTFQDAGENHYFAARRGP